MNKKSKSKTPAKAMTKADLKLTLAETAGVTKKQATEVLEALSNIASKQVSNVGSFIVPGLCKIVKISKPARPEKTMISPFTKKEVTVAAKDAYSVVKVKPVKAFKDKVVWLKQHKK